MDLTGWSDCGILPSGGPGTVSQLGIEQSCLSSSDIDAGDRGDDGLASFGDGEANENMIQENGSSSPQSDSALPSNTEK